MDAMTELANMLKERENPGIPSITVGTVVSPPPEVKIRLNDVIVLSKDRLIFASHMLNGYKRNVSVPGYTMSSIEFTDTIEQGDEVIMVPVSDEQTYFVLDRAVRL